MICRICKVPMVSGTTYEHRNGRDTAKRYDECPNCHDKKYNNSPNFQETLHNKMKKYFL